MEPVDIGTTGGPRREKTKGTAALGGSSIEAIAGAAAVVLSVVGLAGKVVLPVTAIAVIASGIALLFEAAAVAAEEAAERRYEVGAESTTEKGAIGADSIAGIGAIALGILSLIGLYAFTLLPVAAIILGAGLLLSARAPAAAGERTEVGRYGNVVRDAARAASGVHFLVGAAAVVLGIIGVLGNSPIVMTLIATLCIGAASLLSGATIGGRIASALRHAA